MFKMWGGFVFILYSLLQLNVQTAEAYIGNSRGWSSRDLSLRRPLPADPTPNPTVPPVHHIPRPLPKPVEIQRGRSAIAPEISEIVPIETSSAALEQEQPTTRANYPTLPQRVILQRQPTTWSPSRTIVASPPIEITQPPVADPPAPSITSESIVDESNSEVIALEVPIRQPLYEERVISPKDILQEEPASAEDIEVILPGPAPSGRSNRHFLMARPLPRPSHNQRVPPVQPTVAPTMAPTVAPTAAPTVAPTVAPTDAPTVAPEGSIMILKEEPVPEPEEKPIELLPEVIVLPESMPEETSSVALISSSPSEEPAVEIETSIPEKEIYPKISEPLDDEIVYILEEEEVIEEEPDVSNKLPPTMTVVPIAEPPIEREYALLPSVGSAPAYRRPLNRRPLTRKPVPFLPTTPQPSVRPITSRKPIISKTLFPPTVTATPLEPLRRPITTRKPIMGKTLIPPTFTEPSSEPPRRPITTRKPTTSKALIPPTTVKPIPVPSVKPKPTLPPTPTTQGRGLISPPRPSTPAPTQLMDYPCTSESKFYGVANDCDSYVECKASIATMYTCPDGLHYNPRAVWPEYPCGYPWEVKCESNALRREPQPTEDCPRQYGLFPVPNTDCSKYIICQEGIATVMNCPPGLVFNTNTNTCDWPANVPSCNPDVFRGFTCPAPPLEEDGTPSDMIFKYRFGQSCKEYIACQLGHPRLLRCDSGLYFDEISEICIDAEYVQNCRQ